MSATSTPATHADRASDPQALAELASKAIEQGEEEQTLPALAHAAEDSQNPLLWQWKALLERSLDEHEAAIGSFARAAELAPAKVSIAHGHARTAMEAGLDARALYEHALSLAPQNGQILVGMAAARVAAGESNLAIADLEARLATAPAWLYGHEQLAQIKATQGRAKEATSSLERALAQFPHAQPLWETLLNVQLRGGRYELLKQTVERARHVGVNSPEFSIYEGIHAAEFDSASRPASLFGPLAKHADKALDRWRVRHLLRVGAIDDAVALIDRLMIEDETAELWAYAATAWRLAGDARLDWLEGDSAFVRVTNLNDHLPQLDLLAQYLRSLHVAKGEYLDQSVRGGTQTDGPLLSRVDPLVRQLRGAIVGAVQNYIAQLPPADSRHPLLRRRRDRRVRFSGSWSVRLRSAGHHANHVHPLGWISSALYIALPDHDPAQREDAGWLALGEPDEKLGIGLESWRKIEPKVGRLVLFPSHMWHGTVPFAHGERLTVAFDVAPPI